MPNPMDKKKLENFKKVLLKLKDEIAHDINTMSNTSGAQANESTDVSIHVQHMADVATDMYDREFNLGLASNEREVLQKIALALKKIEDRSYGVCIECKKSIPAVRLNAIPYVETCLKCQEKLEAK